MKLLEFPVSSLLALIALTFSAPVPSALAAVGGQLNDAFAERNKALQKTFQNSPDAAAKMKAANATLARRIKAQMGAAKQREDAIRKNFLAQLKGGPSGAPGASKAIPAARVPRQSRPASNGPVLDGSNIPKELIFDSNQ